MESISKSSLPSGRCECPARDVFEAYGDGHIWSLVLCQLSLAGQLQDGNNFTTANEDCHWQFNGELT